jgi:hypothetical protein
MADRWTLTLRNGPRVKRTHFATLGETLNALERQMDELAPAALRRVGRSPIGQLALRRYDAARQVAVRAEVSGPGGLLGGPRGGVDLRGDGSAEAYTGRVRRSLVQLRPGESPYDGVRRVLGGAQGG